MTEKLTTYDPAEDLRNDEALAVFMGAAFSTNKIALSLAKPSEVSI